MSYEPNYRFFCLPVDVNIDDYVETIDWGNDNLEADTVLPLTTDDPCCQIRRTKLGRF